MEQAKELSEFLSDEDVESFMKVEETVFVNGVVGQKWKDHIFFPGFSPNAAKFAYENWTPREGDVLSVSFPKTGTNWTLELIRRILYQDDASDRLSKVVPLPLKMIELEPLESFSLLEKLPLKRRSFLSHLPADLLNMEKIKKAKAKVVYILRNPKDQIVSMYKFIPTLPQYKIEEIKSTVDSGFDEFFDICLKGDLPMMLKKGEFYLDHILSFYNHRNAENVYFIYFEDMKRNLPKEVKRLSEFLEVPMTDKKINEIAEACTFGQMKNSMTEGTSKLAKIATSTMRKGGVGGWKDVLSVTQSERIDMLVKEKLKNVDIAFTYDL